MEKQNTKILADSMIKRLKNIQKQYEVVFITAKIFNIPSQIKLLLRTLDIMAFFKSIFVQP